MSIIVKWKDGTQTEYPDCNKVQSNGMQGLIGKEINGIMEVHGAVDMNEVAELREGGPSEGQSEVR